MTIREAGKGVVVGDTDTQTYRIGFNGNDETELNAKNMSELEELWRSLCPEFGCEANSVDYVERVQEMSIAAKELNKDLIHRANSNSFGGKRGDISEHEYQVYVERVLSWPISEEKKQSILDKLHEKWSEMLKYEAQHVSVMVAGPAKYNSRKLDKSDKILELSAAFSERFKDLEDQIKIGQQKNDKAEKLLKLIEFCRKPDNPCDPTNHLAELAMYDNASFVQIYEELYPEYKWRKNSTIAKLYQKSLAGEIKEIRKEVFFEDANMTAYKEADRVYIKFLMRPKRQLIVALKSRGWWWNSYKNAWSTYPDKLDPEWVASISEKYAKYI